MLAVVAVGLMGHWKLPLGYYLTDGANSHLQSTVITNVITKLWKSGSLVGSVTFDGLAANLKTVQLLGGSLHLDNMCSRLPHPVVPDLCHMVKLMHNLLCEYKILKITNVGSAMWQHIELLHKLQKTEGLNLGNRLRL